MTVKTLYRRYRRYMFAVFAVLNVVGIWQLNRVQVRAVADAKAFRPTIITNTVYIVQEATGVVSSVVGSVASARGPTDVSMPYRYYSDSYGPGVVGADGLALFRRGDRTRWGRILWIGRDYMQCESATVLFESPKGDNRKVASK